MNFYHILFGLKHGFNRNLTWYDNLFVKFYNSSLGQLIAKFLKIKGNTLVWNQLVQGFSSTTGWQATRGTLSASDNIFSYSITQVSNWGLGNRIQNSGMASILKQNHKYYCSFEINLLRSGVVAFGVAGTDYSVATVNEKTCGVGWNRFDIVFDNTYANADGVAFGFNATNYSVGEIVQFKNAMLIDLSAFNNSFITDASSFRSYFPLPYYDYTQGKLLPFKGESLKTVGFNLFDEVQDDNGGINPSTGQNDASITTVFRSTNYINIPQGKQIYLYGFYPENTNSIRLFYYDANKAYLNTNVVSSNSVLSKPQNTAYIRFQYSKELGKKNICINISSTENGKYEPYTTFTLSLPISTHFPTGMKSAGTVYDELAENKAITRVGSVDLGTLSWAYSSAYGHERFSADVSGCKKNVSNASIPNIACGFYSPTTPNDSYSHANDKTITIGTDNIVGGARVFVYDSNYTNSETFKQMLTDNNEKLYYELATYTETTIDPPLDLSYEIEWGGTEQLLPENTSVPTTSPILADMHYPDGDRADQEFTYREIEKTLNRNNRALSIMLGRNVWTDEPDEPLDILLKGE